MLTRMLSIAAIVSLLAVVAVGCARPSQVTVPVEVINASDIGAISFELVYDSSALEATKVVDVGFAKGASAGFNADTPGRLLVVVQNAPTMNGDNELVEVQFDVLKDNGQATLALENIQARVVTSGALLTPQTQPGSVQLDGSSYVSPQIVFGQ